MPEEILKEADADPAAQKRPTPFERMVADNPKLKEDIDYLFTLVEHVLLDMFNGQMERAIKGEYFLEIEAARLGGYEPMYFQDN